MKRLTLSFILFSGIIFMLAQCRSADDATKTANKFFATLVKSDFDKAAKMIELPIGDSSNLVSQLHAMQNNPVNGELKSFKKSMGFSTKINNGITTVELPYALTYEQGTQNFTVVLVDRGNGSKIVSIR